MKSEWNNTFLGEIVDVKQGLAINAKSKHLLVADGMPLLRITDLLNDNQVQFINAEEAPSQCIANKEDLIYTRTGQVGHVFRGKVGVVHNNCFRIIPKDENTTRGYLYWFLSQDKIRKYANDIASGSVQKDLNHSAFKSIPITIPLPKTQYKIEKILNSIEDKIELNRKMNQTLEEMAQALFKSWFVDFDPVHAKAKCSSDAELETAAKELGMSKDVLELFPSEFEESELGMIPKGWSVSTLGSVLVERKENIKPSEYTLENPYVPIDCISSKILSLSEIKSGEEAKSSLIKFYKDDILFGAMRPYFHKVCVAPFNGTTRSTAIVLQSVKTIDYSFGLLYLYQDSTIKYATTNSTGTTMPYVKWKSVMENMQIVLPNAEISKEYNRIVKPLLNNLQSKFDMQNTLKNTRDTLLPKLLSGELDVLGIDLDVE